MWSLNFILSVLKRFYPIFNSLRDPGLTCGDSSFVMRVGPTSLVPSMVLSEVDLVITVLWILLENSHLRYRWVRSRWLRTWGPHHSQFMVDGRAPDVLPRTVGCHWTNWRGYVSSLCFNINRCGMYIWGRRISSQKCWNYFV